METSLVQNDSDIQLWILESWKLLQLLPYSCRQANGPFLMLLNRLLQPEKADEHRTNWWADLCLEQRGWFMPQARYLWILKRATSLTSMAEFAYFMESMLCWRTSCALLDLSFTWRDFETETACLTWEVWRCIGKSHLSQSTHTPERMHRMHSSVVAICGVRRAHGFPRQMTSQKIHLIQRPWTSYRLGILELLDVTCTVCLAKQCSLVSNALCQICKSLQFNQFYL